MPVTRTATTNTHSLDDVVASLSRRPEVDGLMVVGSAAHGELAGTSDYDLVVVLAQMPTPLHVGVTYIDGRVTDLIFHTAEEVDAILAAANPGDLSGWAGRLVGWLTSGRIVQDRRGRLEQARAKAGTAEWLAAVETADDFKPWNGVNYNLQVVRRYLKSDDPLTLLTADIRMLLYGPGDLFFNYFAARRLSWAGEKEAIRHLQQHDPDYLTLFNRFLHERDRYEKFRLYEELAALTLAPVGRLWRSGETIMVLDADRVTPQMEEDALDFWETLVTR